MDTSGPSQTPVVAASQNTLDLSNQENIERLFLRLLGCDNDEKLQKFTDNHLCDILDYAGKNPNNASKFMEILTHYNKVVRNNAAIIFPCERLLQLFESENSVAKNFSHIYLKLARDRTPLEQQLKMLPNFINVLQAKCEQENYDFGMDFFYLCYPALKHLSTIQHDQFPLAQYQMRKAAQCGLETAFRRIFAFPTPQYSMIQENLRNIRDKQPIVCPGMSVEEYKLTAEKIFNSDDVNVAEVKTVAVKLIGLGFFFDSIAFPLLTLAAASNNDGVMQHAETLLKRIETSKLIENHTILMKLYAIYLGDGEPENGSQKIRQAGTVAMKRRVLPLLVKSESAPYKFPNNLKIILDGLRCNDTVIQREILNFIACVVNSMTPQALQTIPHPLFKRLQQFLKEKRYKNDNIQSLVYHCLGCLGRIAPWIVPQKMDFIEELIDSIPYDSRDIGYAKVDCLVRWRDAFSVLDSSAKSMEVRKRFKRLIEKLVVHPRRRCRALLIKFIETALFDENIDVTWVLIKCMTDDERDEGRKEAMRLLDMTLVHKKLSLTATIDELWQHLRVDIEKENGEELILQEGTFPAAMHQASAQFLYALAETITLDDPADLNVDEDDLLWTFVSPKMIRMIREFVDVPRLLKALKIALHAIQNSNDAHLYRVATCFAISYCGLDGITPMSVLFPQTIYHSLARVRDNPRSMSAYYASYLITILIGENEELRSGLYGPSLQELMTKDIPGLCWTCATLVTPVRIGGVEITAYQRKWHLDALDVAKILIALADQGYQRQSSTLETSLGALGFILRYNLIDVPFKDEIREVCEKIAVSRKDGIPAKGREFAVNCIAWLVKDSSATEYQDALESLFRIGEGPPQLELQIIVGEAIVDAILGKFALSRRNYFTMCETDMQLEKVICDPNELQVIQSRITECFMRIVNEKIASLNPHLRRSAFTWLLIMTEKFIKVRAAALDDDAFLATLQNAFAEGLTEEHEFTQDIASKGMGMIYQTASDALRKQLVQTLMKALTEGNVSTRKVQGDTQVFAPGQLGTSPNGDNLTTYKEICSMATDMNQPDLIYKFMALAKHNSVWNAKKGAAFGFSAIMVQAKEEMQQYLPQLIPKLYRYLYDPDVKVQSAMRSIWDIVTRNRRVTNGMGVVDQYADPIARELLPALTDKEWRVRESACLALADLFKGRDTEEMRENIPLYLRSVLRVRDDVKESVRRAADRAAETIRREILSIATAADEEATSEFLEVVIPPIVEEGILRASVNTNKNFCLRLLLDLARFSGKYLRPYLPSVIPILLDMFSESESGILNYAAVRATAAELEELDDARTKIAAKSSMMSEICKMIIYIDTQVLSELTPKICNQLRTSVGLSTRNGAAQFVTHLVLQAPQLMMDNRPQCDKLFQALLTGLNDRNMSIRKQFANSLSYIAKYVTPTCIEALMKKAISMLMTDDETTRVSALHIFSNLLNNCSELMEGYSCDLVPYVYMETFEQVPKGDEKARKRHQEWLDLWAQIVPSTSSAVRLYRNEIIDVALKIIAENEVWKVRAQAARMVAKTVAWNDDQMTKELQEKLLSVLIPAVSGRVWTGKEDVVEAISMTIWAGRKLNALDKETLANASSVLRRESSKRKVDYASSALRSYAKFAAAIEDTDAAEWIRYRIKDTIERLINATGASDEESGDELYGLSNMDRAIRVAGIVKHHLDALVLSFLAFREGSDASASVELYCELLRNGMVAWKAKQESLLEMSKYIDNWELRSPLDATALACSLYTLAKEMDEQQRPTVSHDANLIFLKLRDREMFEINIDGLEEGMNVEESKWKMT
ncbi:unnamed protein product [Caenorhabditis bovis]|uniref:Uncharacterized protein n=1 Tax=Caenorhabditis bovis TaxID=2654633 RepID=A0A8S1EI58_9PELO|nr:unnamed protein product [Caenorhabditis bovis]